MAKTYYQDVDNLIASSSPSLVTGSYELAAGQGVLKRGSVIALGTTGTGSLVAAALAANTPVFILAEDADTGSSSSGSAVPCLGYRGGHFLEDRLITGSSYSLKTADLEKMRQFGLYTSTGATSQEA